MTIPITLRKTVLVAEYPRRASVKEEPRTLTADELIGDLDPGWLRWREETKGP